MFDVLELMEYRVQKNRERHMVSLVKEKELIDYIKIIALIN